jgi:hypothetical protein
MSLKFPDSSYSSSELKLLQKRQSADSHRLVSEKNLKARASLLLGHSTFKQASVDIFTEEEGQQTPSRYKPMKGKLSDNSCASNSVARSEVNFNMLSGASGTESGVDILKESDDETSLNTDSNVYGKNNNKQQSEEEEDVWFFEFEIRQLQS